MKSVCVVYGRMIDGEWYEKTKGFSFVKGDTWKDVTDYLESLKNVYKVTLRIVRDSDLK